VLRAEITRAAGFELCRMAVREGMLGRSIPDPGTLRTRLRDASIDAAIEIDGDPQMTLTRVNPEDIEAPTARWAALPWATRDTMEAAAADGRQSILVNEESSSQPRIVYAP